jgi:hypothetical protein
VIGFVDDVCRYQQGDFVLPPDEAPVQNPSHQPAAAVERDYSGSNRPSKEKKATPKHQNEEKGSIKQQSAASAKTAFTKSPPPTKPSPTTAKIKASQSATPTEPASATKSTYDDQKEAAIHTKTSKKPRPRQPAALQPKGTATAVCGCFGTMHKALTNCLFCGRVACNEEGYTFCPFCGYQLGPVQPPDEDDA